MNQPIILGLTGRRQVGKSEVTKFLTKHCGFRPTHAFRAGKAAILEYYIASDIPMEIAWRMVYGDLKDTPSTYLPNGVASRFFMEEFGRFMGVQMGADWTLGLELKKMQHYYPEDDLICESIVYEEKQLRDAGGYIVRITRPGVEAGLGHKTDEYESQIVADMTIENSGTLVELRDKVSQMLREFL